MNNQSVYVVVSIPVYDSPSNNVEVLGVGYSFRSVRKIIEEDSRLVLDFIKNNTHISGCEFNQSYGQWGSVSIDHGRDQWCVYDVFECEDKGRGFYE